MISSKSCHHHDGKIVHKILNTRISMNKIYVLLVFIPGVPQKVERSIFVSLVVENIVYFDFIR